MYDLIWIGNTLYPRWFVFAVAIGVFLILFIGLNLLADKITRSDQ